MLNVYGADFSGAMNPKIFYAHGVLEGSYLTLKSTVTCDDRLDLYHAIVQSGRSIWGLDFPFSIPAEAMTTLGYASINEMLASLARMTRREFADFIASEMDDYPRKCTTYDKRYCRHTDIAVQAHSVFKTVNPNLRVMLYSGLKMIAYLVHAGVNVYPFTRFLSNVANEIYDPWYASIYEIYPSYAWRRIGMRRSLDIDTFIEKFNDLNLITIMSELNTDMIKSQDLADSIVACVMMAAAYVTQDMKQGWDYRLPIFTDKEWEWRNLEGLIVRF